MRLLQFGALCLTAVLALTFLGGCLNINVPRVPNVDIRHNSPRDREDEDSASVRVESSAREAGRRLVGQKVLPDRLGGLDSLADGTAVGG